MDVWLVSDSVPPSDDHYRVCLYKIIPAPQHMVICLRTAVLLAFEHDVNIRYAMTPSLHWVTTVSGT